MLKDWEATSLPSLLLCPQTLCPSTWMSGGHSSSWPESLTAPSRFFGRNVACTGLALPHADPLLGEDHGILYTHCSRSCFSLGQAECQPHLKCQHLDFCTF